MNIKTDFLEYKNNILLNKLFYVPIFFFLILAYAYDLLNASVGIDDLCRDYYIGDKSLITSMRWGTYYYGKIFSTAQYSPLVDKFLALVFLFTSAIVICFVLYMYANSKDVWGYVCFTVLYMTNPLINEIWEYNLANMVIGINMILVSLVILFMQFNNKSIKNILIMGLLLTPVMSSYETAIFAYISLVIFLLLYRYYIVSDNDTVKLIFIIKEGGLYAIPLFIALIAKVVIGKLLLLVYGLEYIPGIAGDNVIAWKDYGSLRRGIECTLYGIKQKYFDAGWIYLPIALFVMFLFVFIVMMVCTIKKEGYILLIGFIASLFFQSFIQGKVMPYRTATTIWVFNALVGFYLLDYFNEKKIIKSIITIICLVVAFRSALYLNNIFHLNSLRTENELAIIRHLGYELYENYDTEKTVIITGNYNLGDFINDQITINDDIGGSIYKRIYNIEDLPTDRIIETDVNSVINWSLEAFGNQKEFEHLFAYCGYSIHTLDHIDYVELEKYRTEAEERIKTEFGIVDMGSYIIIKL